jgi:hypothetical protein
VLSHAEGEELYWRIASAVCCSAVLALPASGQVSAKAKAEAKPSSANIAKPQSKPPSAKVAKPFPKPPIAREPLARVRTVYYNGEALRFTGQQPPASGSWFRMGRWQFGARTWEQKPRDGRLNLYIVSPGSQYLVAGEKPFAFNCVINGLPKKPSSWLPWDVYWAVVLDPDLNVDILDERNLIIYTQSTFTPDPDAGFEQFPGHEVLRRYLGIRTMADLKRFRRHRSRELPKLIIVPAHLMLRANVREKPVSKTARASRKPAITSAPQ